MENGHSPVRNGFRNVQPQLPAPDRTTNPSGKIRFGEHRSCSGPPISVKSPSLWQRTRQGHGTRFVTVRAWTVRWKSFRRVEIRYRSYNGRRFRDHPEIHACIIEEVTRDEQRWISETKVNGNSARRMMVMSYLTEERHLAELGKALTAAANKLSRKQPRSGGSDHLLA